jgi:hypothetical protein
MVFSFANILGLLVSLPVGLLLMRLFRRFVYPVLSARYERAKLTGTHRHDPARIARAAYVIGMVAIPALGFFLGGALFKG